MGNAPEPKGSTKNAPWRRDSLGFPDNPERKSKKESWKCSSIAEAGPWREDQPDSGEGIRVPPPRRSTEKKEDSLAGSSGQSLLTDISKKEPAGGGAGREDSEPRSGKEGRQERRQGRAPEEGGDGGSEGITNCRTEEGLLLLSPRSQQCVNSRPPSPTNSCLDAAPPGRSCGSSAYVEGGVDEHPSR